MSDQSDAANEFARRKLGSDVDAAAAASGLAVVPAPQEDNGLGKRPWVELPGRGNRDLSDFAKDLARHLAVAPIFRRENLIVTVDAQTGSLRLMSAERFLTWVADQVVIYEIVSVKVGKGREDHNVRRSMNLSTARACLESDAFYGGLRELTRVNLVPMPAMRKDGRIELLQKGYDPESGIFTLVGGVKIDDTVTIDQARALLNDYYGDFPWADVDAATGLSRSKAVAITLALALFGIGLQKVEAARMGFVTRANTQGGGKSLSTQIGISASFGLPKGTPRANEEEMRKVLDAAAMQGASYLFFDNLKHHLESALLEAFMTSPVWSGRVMATQTFFEAKKSTVLLITGNNLTLSPDLQRRVLQCDLHVENFDLQEQTHRRELNPVVLSAPAVQSEFLSALWAIVRHWDGAGRPPASLNGKPYRVATFAEWSDLFGGMVEAAGWGNPLLKPSEDQMADQKTPHQRMLVELLAGGIEEGKNTIEFTFQELIDCCWENDLFAWLLEGTPKDRGEGKPQMFEVKSKCASKMGKMFTDEMSGRLGRVYSIKGNRRVRFVKKGDGRLKRYCLDLLPAKTV